MKFILIACLFLVQNVLGAPLSDDSLKNVLRSLSTKEIELLARVILQDKWNEEKVGPSLEASQDVYEKRVDSDEEFEVDFEERGVTQGYTQGIYRRDVTDGYTHDFDRRDVTAGYDVTQGSVRELNENVHKKRHDEAEEINEEDERDMEVSEQEELLKGLGDVLGDIKSLLGDLREERRHQKKENKADEEVNQLTRLQEFEQEQKMLNEYNLNFDDVKRMVNEFNKPGKK